jgi:hypothetical protein
VIVSERPGRLAGGSSYVNLLDGDAQTVAFTVATARQTVRLSAARRMADGAAHPAAPNSHGAHGTAGDPRSGCAKNTSAASVSSCASGPHSEGLFPFIRVLSNVIVRELQTMAILLDVYLGVPVIYSTFMQYDELGHHFGPSSFQALRDLRRTDARIREIRRMIENVGGRQYDLVILSDHGMTPSSSYRVRFG